MPPPRVSIQTEDFDLSQEVEALHRDEPGIGAVASFVGIVRESADGAGLTALELEHYPDMTERAIESMIDEARNRFDIRSARVVHRIGILRLHEQIMMVAVASAHRGDAFQACEFLMDYLKTQAPFWKKEIRADGSARWVDARAVDDQALRRWGVPTDDNAGFASR